MNAFYEVFLYFSIYSILGWIVEMIYCRILEGKFVERGFFYGPYCPIYGVGAVIVLHILLPFSNNIIAIFFLTMFSTAILEYITSFVMEKLFDAKWWDYSNVPLNIHGRVCLLNSVLFGLLGVILITILHPVVHYLVSLIPINSVSFIVNTLMLAFCADFTATLNSLINFKEKLQEIQNITDSIIEKTKSKTQSAIFNKKLFEIKENLIEKSLTKSTRRFLRAFPNLKFYKLNNSFEELKRIFEKNIPIKNNKNEQKDNIENKNKKEEKDMIQS